MKVIVEAISSKEVKTKFGMKPTYSFKGNDGQWYKMGFKKPQFNKGEELEFEFNSGQYGNEVTAILSAPSATTLPVPTRTASGSPQKPSYGGGYSRGVFPIPPTDGQRSIIRQNALTHAGKVIEICGFQTVPKVEDVAKEMIRLAKVFESYTAGDTEAALAKKALREASDE